MELAPKAGVELAPNPPKLGVDAGAAPNPGVDVGDAPKPPPPNADELAGVAPNALVAPVFGAPNVLLPNAGV
jgi:hypothetical protein